MCKCHSCFFVRGRIFNILLEYKKQADSSERDCQGDGLLPEKYRTSQEDGIMTMFRGSSDPRGCTLLFCDSPYKGVEMLGKPKFGWTQISVGNHAIGYASYLDDVPDLMLRAFIDYLKDKKNFMVTFDAEGYEFGIFSFAEDLYTADNGTRDGTLRATLVRSEEIGLEQYAGLDAMVRKLAKEAVDDVRKNIEDWVTWLPEADEFSEERKAFRRKSLLVKCNIVERLASKA